LTDVQLVAQDDMSNLPAPSRGGMVSMVVWLSAVCLRSRGQGDDVIRGD
jgi:hypothetical protein